MVALPDTIFLNLTDDRSNWDFDDLPTNRQFIKRL